MSDDSRSATEVAARLRAALADRYTIERELGQGGMATVYLAEDIKHHRKVAIKVLRPDLAAALGPERFMQEIEIAARLQHPHILGVHDSGQSDGFLYYVMPYVEGESLRERLARQGELPIHEAVRLLAEIADALGHAHQRGVVHRDIKPENVMLSGRHALVMDFGVAKAVNEASGRNRLTTLGVALGTPAYMAPEQASADPHLDHRVDIYALGVVGYELLAGRPPFAGASPQQVLAAHVTQAPEMVSMYRPAISPVLAAVIMRALEKRPADRWQTAEEMLHQLEPLATPSGGMTPTQTQPISATRPVTRSPWLMRSVIGAALVACAALAVFLLTGRHGSAAAAGSTGNRVAVLPFSTSGDSTNEAFAVGEHAELVAQLTRLNGMHVSSRSATVGYRDQSNLAKIAQELGVDRIVAGTIQRSGDHVHVTVELIDPATRNSQWAGTYDTLLTASTLFAIQGDIARNVAVALKSTLTAADQAVLSEVPTKNLEALDAYHRGLVNWEGRGGNGAIEMQKAVEALELAVKLDPQFARAWGLLSMTQSWRLWSGYGVDTLPARAALDRVTALAPGGPDAATAEGYYYYYGQNNYPRAIRAFETLRSLQPDLAAAHEALGLLYRRVGRWDEAIQSFERAVPLDPRNPGLLATEGETFLYMKRFDEARAVIDRGLAVAPASSHLILRALDVRLLATGDTSAARALLAAAGTAVDADTRAMLIAGLAQRNGRFAEAAAALAPIGTAGTYFFEGDNLVLQAMLLWMNHDAAGMKAMAVRVQRSSDSALRVLQSGGMIDRQLIKEDVEVTHATAMVMLGDVAGGIAQAERANQAAIASHDAISMPNITISLISAYLIAGRIDPALDQVEHLLSIPSNLYVAQLKLDPLYAPLRASPRFAKIIAGKK